MLKLKLNLKVTEDYKVYRDKLQELSGKRELKAQVEQALSKIPGIKVICLKLHGVIHRNSLKTNDGIVYSNFPLMRIQVKYQKGNEVVVTTPIVYPADVIPYGRNTLDVMKNIAKLRFKEGISLKILADICYERYDISDSSAKRVIQRIKLVFDRLVSSKIISAININPRQWICQETRSFRQLRFLYSDQLLTSPLASEPFDHDLFSP